MRREALVLLAAALLRVPASRLRALAAGDDGALRDWLANESAGRLAEARRDARLAAARIGALGAELVALSDPGYPGGLKALKDPPAFLIARGPMPRTPWAEGIAIVGSRDADPAAAAFARGLAARVTGPVVSGLARGIDAAAHEGALAAGTRTIAYLGNGLGATFPPEHAELQERIVAAGGVIATERLPDEPVAGWALVKRDRLQAAHAAVLVLVQSEADGGAMHTVKYARQIGRPVFVLAPRDGDAFEGNRRALAQGARCLPWDPDEAASLLR
jgi:DNA processing protein